MNKVIIIGCPGSGKSTFARKLRDITEIPLIYLDQIWHKPDKTNRSREEFDAILAEQMKEERWIIDGNYNRTLTMRLEQCDTVFLFDLPVNVCIRGAESRIGKKREDLPWAEDELDEEFRQWIVSFPQDSLPHIYKLLTYYQDKKKIIIFKSREEADEYLHFIQFNHAGERFL